MSMTLHFWLRVTIRESERPGHKCYSADTNGKHYCCCVNSRNNSVLLLLPSHSTTLFLFVSPMADGVGVGSGPQQQIRQRRYTLPTLPSTFAGERDRSKLPSQVTPAKQGSAPTNSTHATTISMKSLLRPSPTAEDSLGELPEEDTGSSRDRRRSLPFSSSWLQKSQKIDSVRYKHDHVSVLT